MVTDGMGFKKVLALVVGACHVVASMCHGYLAVPASRNLQHNSDWCPWCLNGPGVCGDARGRRDHESGGKFASPPRVSGTYKSGGVLKARVVITANHRGRWGLRLCPLKSASQGAERSAMKKKSCLKQLKRADGRGAHVYLSPSASASSGSFRLPRGVKCSRCVLQWVWETGHNCNPSGTPRPFLNRNLGTCGRRGAAGIETFTNCADIRIR